MAGDIRCTKLIAAIHNAPNCGDGKTASIFVGTHLMI